jgi:hypothetical protein
VPGGFNSLLKKGTRSEKWAFFPADFNEWRRACLLFQQAANDVRPILHEREKFWQAKR